MNPQIPIPKTSMAARRCRSTGFTLVEVLVSMVILLMMMLIITQVIGTTQRTWRQASSRLAQFREARNAFDTITRSLAQATINSYRTYDYGYGGPPGLPTSALQAPVGYVRTAELGMKMGLTNSIFDGLGAPNVTPGHAVLFQAPLGYTNDPTLRPLDRLLCMRGYFVYFSDDKLFLPVGLSGRLESKSRFRLYEYQPTTETNMVFSSTSAAPDKWTTIKKDSTFDDNIRPVAENILTLIMAPSFNQTGGGAAVLFSNASKADSYTFNSYTDTTRKYQLPSSIEVVMVAMDEETATRLAQQYGHSPPQLFPSTFSNPGTLTNDLKLVRESLLRQKINFRIFSSTVVIPAADS